MKTDKTLFSFLLFALFVNLAEAGSLDNASPIDLAALTGDYVASNPGFETVVPSWNKFDSDGNGVPDGDKFHFDVYKTGTVTKLFSTLDVFFPECPPISKFHSHYFEKVADFKRIGNIIILTAILRGNCTGMPTNKLNEGYLYAVNVSASSNTPWSKLFNQRLDTGVIPDRNGNGVAEVMAMTSTLTTDTAGFESSNATFNIFDGKTGVAMVAPRAYPMQR